MPPAPAFAMSTLELQWAYCPTFRRPHRQPCARFTTCAQRSVGDHTVSYTRTSVTRFLDQMKSPSGHRLGSHSNSQGRWPEAWREFRWGVIVLSLAVLPGICLGLVVSGYLNSVGESSESPRQVTITQPTGYPSPPPKVNKVDLIIQQNPECWLGVPGATCDPGTRTFLGQ